MASTSTLGSLPETFTSEKHSPPEYDLRNLGLPSPKKRKTEKIITPPLPVAKPCQADNQISIAYENDNLQIMEEVRKLIKDKESGTPLIIALKCFIQAAVVDGDAGKLDFLVKGFEEYSKEWKIVHPSMLFLQEGVDHSSTKRVTLMQQCLAQVSNKEVCAHLLNWVSRRNLIRYLLKPTEEGQDMLITEIAAKDRVDILKLMFEKINDFNLLEEEEESLREQVKNRGISSAAAWEEIKSQLY